MLRKIENSIAVALVFVLSLLPLLVKLLQDGFGIPIPGSDTAQVNVVFVFACVAGIITYREDRHLSLATLSDSVKEPFKTVISLIRSGAVIAVLTVLFFSAFSEAFLAFTPENKIWGIPLTLIFCALPLLYVYMLVLAIMRSSHKIAALIGLVIGIYMAMGPITGVLYSLFGWDNLQFLYAVTDSWLWFSGIGVVPLVLIMIVLAVLGIPLFIAIAGIAYICFSQGGGYVEMIPLESYRILTDKSIAAIPLFTIAGYMLAEGSAGKRLVDVFKSFFGWFRGGAVIATVIVAAFFTTFTGASGVTILALGGLLTIVLTGNGYGKTDAQSLITSSGSIGLLFPPSMAIIVYGTTNYFSVDVFDVFKGALLPGVLLAVSMMIIGVIRDKATDRPRFSLKASWIAVKHASLELLLPVFIMIAFFSGFLSLSEIASFTVLYVFVLETFIRKDFNMRKAFKVISLSIPIAGGVLIILSASSGLSSFLIDANIPNMLADYVLSVIQSKYVFLLLLNIALLLVGCLMDIYSAILVVSPLIIPVAESFGIDPVHSAVIFLMNMQLGFLTPPVGMNLFIASYAFDTPLMKICKNIVPYLVIQLIVLLIVTYIPFFSTWLL